MDLILDTCALLSLSGIARKKLTKSTLQMISEADSLYVSACSLFEIALKHKRGQLEVTPFESPKAFWDEATRSYECESLPVDAEDFLVSANLPDHHNDPFDRIIIAQAIRTKSLIVTYDKHFAHYATKVIN